MAPSGVLLLRVMATRVLADLLLLGESNPGHSPRQPPVRRRAGMPPIRSLRLRHTTPWHTILPGRTLPQPPAAPACQRARSRSPGKPRHGRCGLHRFTRPIRPPVPRSGVAPLRSPQSLPYVRPRVKGSVRRHCALHSLGRDAPRNCLRSPARRSKPHPPTSGTPSVYYAITTMSSRMSWVALRAPARSTAMGPWKQDDYCTRSARLCQATGAAACRDARAYRSRSNSEKSLSASAAMLWKTTSGGVSWGNGAFPYFPWRTSTVVT
jgi:hypothetical protein